VLSLFPSSDYIDAVKQHKQHKHSNHEVNVIKHVAPFFLARKDATSGPQHGEEASKPIKWEKGRPNLPPSAARPVVASGESICNNG
jgi:hypothetical protein